MNTQKLTGFSIRTLVSAALASFAVLATESAQAAVMHSDVSIQTYTDFGQNMGRYTTVSNALLEHIRATEGGVYIYYTGGQENYKLQHGLINFEATADIGAYNAIGHNFIATVAHNGVQNPTFSGRVVGDANAIHYATIEYRYNYTLSPEKNVFSLRPAVDYKIARTSKLITDVTGSTVYSGSTAASDLVNQMLYRAGSGTQQLASYDGEVTHRLGAYGYIIGGITTIEGATDNTNDSPGYRDIIDDSFSITWTQDDWSPSGINNLTPLPNAIRGGDSGSPGWIWNETTQQYEYFAAGQSGGGFFSQSRGATQWTTETMESYNKHVTLTDAVGVITINAVTDTREEEMISCDIQGVSATPTYGTVTDANGTVLTDFVGVKSGLNTWHSLTAIKDLQNWYAYGNEYLNTNTATSNTAVSYADLFLTENLVFTAAQAQTTVNVGADVDLGIGYVQFSAGELSSAKFTLQSAGNHQLNSAGYIVDAGVDLYVTLTNTDADYMREWRKVGDGNLHVAGTGNNEIFLNLGGSGKTYLEQSGGYAAYNVIANNGAIVVISDTDQIARDFTFGAGGGVLDMNGNSMEWKLNNTDVSATGFTVNALTEEAVITNTAGKAVTLTYTEGGKTKFVGSFKDTESGALKVVYNGGAEASWTLNGILTDLSKNSGSGLEVASGQVSLVGTNTVHAVGSATGTNTSRYTNENDWHYADAKMNVSVAENATFELGSHARLTGNVTVADGGTFIIREGVKHQYEYIEGGYTLEDTYAIRDYYGLKGAINLGNEATLKFEYSDGTTSENIYESNIAGTGNISVDLGTSGASLVLSGHNTFSGTKTLTSGTLVAETSASLGTVDKDAAKWLVESAGIIASRDGENLLPLIHADSSGVFALTQDIETQLDLDNNYKLIIGSLAGCKVNYGKSSSGTYSTLKAYNHDNDASTKNAWLLGGGGGELIVYFQLSGDNDLILGNQYGKGTVTLANTANDFTGDIIFNGQITLNYVDGGLGESTVNLPYTNRIFASANSLPTLGVGSDGVLLLDNYSGTSIDVSGSGYSDIYLGADKDKTITSITLANGDTTYRFGGTTGTLTVNTVLDDRNGAAHNLLVDGQTFSGGKVILAQAATLTGTVNVIGYDSSKTALTEGDITLGFSANNALANASSVTIGVGGILDLNGTKQTFDTRLTTVDGGIITDNSEGKTGTLILQYGSENASLNIGELGTLQLDSGRFQAPANHAKNVVVNDGGQYHATAGTHSAVFTLSGTGWNASSDSAKDGALRLEGGAEITGGVSLAGDASVQVYHDADAGTISGVVSTGEYTLTKIGAGTLTLDAAVSGNLAMSAGTMTQSGSFSGTLAMNGGNLTLAGSSYASKSVIDLNAGTTTLSFSDRAFSATLNVNDGAIANLSTTDGLNYNGSSSVVVNSGGTLNLGSNRWTLASGNKLTLAGGTVSGEGQTATNDAGEVTGRYGALDFINAGNVVDVTASSELSANVRVRGSVDFAIADGATLDFSGNLYKYSGSNANFSKSGTGTLNFSGAADAGSNFTLNAGATAINSQDFRGNITVAENATLSLAGTLALSQAIANAGSVTVDNTNITFDLGNLTISEDKVYTLISGGTITNWDLLDKSNFTVDGVVLSGRSGFSLGTAGTVTIDLSQTAASLVWASQNGSNVWNVEQATNWDNAGAFDKFYDGDAVTFSTADAEINITENVIAGNMTATEDVSFTSTGTDVTFSQIEGGIISVADGKTVTFDKTISTTGKLQIAASNGGMVSIAADAEAVASSVVVNEGSIFGLSVADASETTYSGAISGAGSFEKLGAGTLVLDTAQEYAGGTYISGGTLKITNQNALGTSNRVSIGTGAILDLAVNMDSTANAYVLAGGTLKASVETTHGQRQIASGDGAIVLTADSTVEAAANFGMISGNYAENELDLAGHTLTKTGSANFYLANTTVTAGTIKIAEGTLNITNHGSTDASAADIVIAGGTLYVGGNFLVKSLTQASGDSGTVSVSGGTLNILGNSTISNGITSETGTLVVGDGENSALVSVGRLELGNSNGGSSAFMVNAGATLKVTGSTNTWTNYTNYKTNSAVFGEWNNYTTTTIVGTLLAKDAEFGLGDYGGTFTIENGGLIAAKGLGQATSVKAETGKFELSLNDGGTLLLGTSGLSTTKTTNTVSLAAGTIGTFADSTTVATALTLTSETGTTFDTQKYVFTDDGNSVSRGEDAAAMTVSGAISGTGNFIKTGAGTLTLSNNFGSFEGNFIVNGGELLLSGSNSGYSGQFVVNGGTLKLGTTSGVLGTTDLEGTGTRYAAVVNAGGTLDINGQTQGGNNCYQIELAGGSLINNGSGVGTDQRQITGLKLSADSEIGGSGNFGLIASGYAANTLDLGGNTLTKTGTNTFWLASTTVTAGTFKIQEGKVEVISQTLSSVDASAAQFAVEGGELAVYDNFLADGISVSKGATVTFGSGITVALGSTIQNAGTVTIGSGMIFNLDNLTPDGKNYVIISNTGTVSGWENLTIDNFTHSTQSNLRLSEEAGTYYVYAYHGALTWVGATDANGAGTWDLGSSQNWTYNDNGTTNTSGFFNEDEVIFATDGAQVTVASGLTVAPANMAVNESVTFSGENYTIAPTGTVTIAAEKTLTLDGTGTLSGILANSGTIAIGADATLGVSASRTALGTVKGSGRIELPKTTLTDGTTFRDASTWTGTVAFTESLGGSESFGLSVSNYGNAYSVVELNGFSGGYFTEQDNGTITSDLVLNGDVNLTNGNHGQTLTVAGAISGSGSFSYSFNNGQIFVFNGSVALPSMAFTVGSGAKTFNGVVDLDSFSSNAGAVTFSGETTDVGTLTSGGNVSITAGTATIGTLTQTAGTVSVAGGTLNLTGNSSIPEKLELKNGGNANIGIANNAMSAPEITIGQIQIHNATGNYTQELTINSGLVTVTSTDKNQNTSSGVLIGHWKNGAGILTLNDGILNAKDTYTTVSWDSNGTLNINGGEYNTYGLALGGASGASRDHNATVNLSGGRLNLGAGGITNYSGASNKTFNLSGGTLGAFDSWTSSVAMNLSDTATIDTEDADSAGTGLEITLSGDISGTGNLIKNGVGTLVLSGSNTTLDGVSVEAGTLTLSGTSVTVTDASSVASGAELNLSGANVTLYSTIENAGTTNIASGTTFALDNLTAVDNVYTLISGAGTVSGWDTLTSSNFTLTSQSAIRKLGSSYSVLVGAGTLTWAGTVDNVWNTNSTANWTLSGANDSVNFFDGDSVIFATADANVSLANDVSVGTMTVSQNLTLSGAGTIALSAPGNLVFENASTLSLGEGVTLNLGSSDGALDLSKVEGTGTVVYVHTVNGGGSSGLVTSANFTGTIDYTGNLNWSDTYNAGQVSIGNDGITLRLSSRDGALDGIWGKWAKTFNNHFVFATNYEIFSGNEGVTFAGDVDATGVALSADGYSKITFAGETTTIGSLNFDSSVSVEFGGTSTVGTLTQNHGTLTVSGDLTTNAYTGVNLPGGDNSTVSVSSGASWTNTGDFYLRHTGNGTTTFTVDGNVNVGGKLYISRDGNGTIEINDGGVLAVSTLEFGQYWDGVASKGSWVNVNAGGTLVLDTISIGNNLNTSELKLNGGTFGTSSAALTIDASTTSGAGAGALPLTLGTGTTSTIRTSVYENNAFGATAATISIVNAISGDGALNVDGTGTLTLSGANSYTGGTTISGGKLIATNASALGTNTVTANANGTLELAFADETFANALAGDGAVSVNSTGTLTLSGDNCNFEGVLSVAAGTLNASGTALGAGMVSVASGATLALSGNLTLFSTIENAGTTNIANGTTFVLDNLTATNNVYTLISGEGTVSGWDALTNASFTQSGTTVSSLRKSASGYTVLAGNGELTWTGASSSVWDTDTTANWTFDGGVSSVNFFDGDSVIFATENAQVSFAENASVAPANMSVNKNVTFSGTNATINVLAGALTIADSQTLTINDGVTLDLGATDTNVSLNIAGSGKIKRTNSGGHGVRTAITGDFSGTLDYSGQLGLANFALNENAMLRISELTSGNEMWSKSGIAKVLNNDIVFATNYTINIGGDDITLGGNVSFENSDNTLTVKNGWPHQGGTLTISGTATIGTMAISDGSVVLGTNNFAGDTPNIVVGLSSAGSSLKGNLTIEGGAKVTVKSGSDALNYSTSNTITVASGGELYFNDARWTIGSGNKIVLSGGKITGTGNSGNGALDFYQTNTLTANGGVASSVSVPIRLRANLTIAVGDETDSDSSLSIFGNIFQNGSRSLTKTGAGRLTLSGANTFTGGISVDAGTLNASGTALGRGTVSIASGATLNLSGENLTLYSTIQNAGTTNIANGTTFVLDNLTATNNVYTLISGEGTVSGWDALENTSFTQSGTAVSSLRKSASNYGVLVGAGTLTWVGDADGAGTWNETDANWTVNNAGDKFVYASGDSVIFATADANVSLANDVSVGTITVSKNVIFEGAGTIELANANLTIADGASLNLAEGVILDLGQELNGTLNKNIIGAGTIVWGNSSTSTHRATIDLGENFTGTLEFSGRIRLNTADNFVKSLGGTTELVLNGVDIWTDSGSTTDTAGIYSLNVATVTIGESEVNGHAGSHLYLAGTGVSFNGEFNAEGKTVTLAGGKNTFAGTTNIGTLNITGETATLSGGATITTVENAGTLAITAGMNSVTTLNTTGTLNVSGGTNTIDALNITGGTTTLSGTTETAISTLSHTGGTVEFAAGTNSITTLSSTGQIKQTGGMLSITGGNAVTLRQEAGTLNLVGNVTLSGSNERQGLYACGTVNVGDENGTAAQVNVSRVEFGDNNSANAVSTVTIREGANLFVSGGTNTWNGNNVENYKTNSVVLGEWSTKTTLTVDGFFKAESAEVGLGDSGADIVVNGTLAAKGLGQAIKADGTFDLTLNDGAWLLLGESGIANVKTRGTATFNAGTVASFAEGTTIAKNLVLNSATGTTFNTSRYVATEGGFYFHDHNNDTGSAIVIDGVVSGDGKLITTGNGSLTLSNVNTYTGGTEISSGKLIAANASALGTGAVTNNAELELTFAEGTMSNIISGEGSLSVNTTGTVTLSGTNTYTGNTTVAAGTLKITNAKALGSATNSVTVNADATLELGTGMSEMERSYTLAGGKLKVTAYTDERHKQMASGNNVVQLTGSSVIEVAENANFGMVSSGYGKNQLNLNGNVLTKTGLGTLTIANTMITAGTVRIEEGTINAYKEDSNASAADFVVVGGSGKIGVESGITLSVGSLTLEVSDSYTDATLSGAGTLTIGGDGKITVKRSELAALDVAAETAYTYQVAASGASFDDDWTTASFELAGWSSEWFVQSYESGLLTIAIPEPTTFGLFAGLGALLLVGKRRRRKA